MGDFSESNLGGDKGHKGVYEGDERRRNHNLLDEVIWGGPKGPGLAHVVPQLAQSVVTLTNTVNKLAETLMSEGGISSRVNAAQRDLDLIKKGFGFGLKWLAPVFFFLVAVGIGTVIFSIKNANDAIAFAKGIR